MARMIIGSCFSVILILVCLCLFFHAWFWVPTIGLALLSLALIYEWRQLCIHKNLPIPLVSLSFFALLSIILAAIAPKAIPLVFFGCVIFHIIHYFFYPSAPAISYLSALFTGFFYICLPLVAILLLAQNSTKGAAVVVFTIICVKLSDIFAYFLGKPFGKHKLAKQISPNKSWEGLIGGAIAAIIFALFFQWISEIQGWPLFFSSYIAYIFFAILLAILGQIGDLFESAFKRDAAVKDSNQIPGVGGLLDIMDSILFTIPLSYAIFNAWMR